MKKKFNFNEDIKPDLSNYTSKIGIVEIMIVWCLMITLFFAVIPLLVSLQ